MDLDPRPGLRLRPAVLDDAVAVAEFQTTCWREVYAGLVPADYLARVGVAERTVRWRERLATGSREVALAELGDTVVGVVSWRRTPAAGVPPLELLSLYVGEPRRGQGLGARLLEHAVGDDPAHLWVFAENLRAQAFYRRHGFAAHGRRAVDPDTGLDELLLVRK